MKGSSKSSRVDLAGEKFGNLTVIEATDQRENGYIVWRCRCDCGREVKVSRKKLLRGTVTSCGCQIRMRHRKDIRGNRYGRLTALYPTEKRDKKGSVYWHCKCDCGREKDITEDKLEHGNVRSCGCLQQQTRDRIGETREKLHFVDGTCIEMLERRKHRSDNTSGFRGVYVKEPGSYKVSIGLQQKRYYLGTFHDFEEAVQARLEAEEIIEEKFLKPYRKWEQRAKEDPEWGEKNPFSPEDFQLGTGHFQSGPGDF